eukprot:gnl/MRDRNA2_/MRDRNA2_84770_c0_seq1.p1 gnl/MRDRNA2_/MRDRNA2_84770_c0~~gnl/MRDRNA2_/MRDRNA2_84770_c0_seq1.p1  ORF type:complete len:369 (-),score=55.99 gnl/MRDRNA2_/MRDRNA2_84770_c0_seq1:67-1173(-)
MAPSSWFKACFRASPVEPTDEPTVTDLSKVSERAQSPEPNRRKGSKTLVRRSSQCLFAEPNQTAIVFDFDDTLFPTTYVEGQHALLHPHPNQPLPEEQDEEMKDVRNKIEACQVSAESLLRSIQHYGGIFIVTLSGRNKLRKQCEQWYPRIWKLLNDKVTIVYAIELHNSLLHMDHSELDNSEYSSSYRTDSRFSAGYWAWVKGRAITQEMDRFYSQYKGQTWKNIISVGDSNFERYGTLGAATAYVQKRFGNPDTTESSAYVKGWQNFESDSQIRFERDPQWSQDFEGLHDGHMFKVRTKVMKLMEDPGPADLALQLQLLLGWFPAIVCLDGSINLFLENLNEETVKSHELALTAKRDCLFSKHRSV